MNRAFDLLLLFTASPRAQELPKGFTVPADFREDTARRQYWEFDSAEFDFLPPNTRNTTHEKVEGHLWKTAFSAAAQQKGAPQKNDVEAVSSLIASDFEKDGWAILRRQGWS